MRSQLTLAHQRLTHCAVARCFGCSGMQRWLHRIGCPSLLQNPFRIKRCGVFPVVIFFQLARIHTATVQMLQVARDLTGQLCLQLRCLCRTRRFQSSGQTRSLIISGV